MRLQAAEACQGLTIQSFLTLPMQRITRLPLLVDAVCHRLDPTHPDYQTVVGCLNALQGVTTILSLHLLSIQYTYICILYIYVLVIRLKKVKYVPVYILVQRATTITSVYLCCCQI